MTSKVTLTGTGTPLLLPGRAGPGALVQCGDLNLQFDAGRATSLRLADAGVGCEQISALFLTHHHSDHLTGMADLVISRWVRGNASPLPVIAPLGPTSAFAERLLDQWRDDIAIRRAHSPTDRPPPELIIKSFGARPYVDEVWSSGSVKVSTILVHHEPVVPAVAYRVDTDDGVIVISGDTITCPELEELAQGCDILVHEAGRPDLIRAAGLPQVAEYHADTVEVGALAARLGVRVLMLTHLEPTPMTQEAEQGFVDGVRAGGYDGVLVVGRDLASAELGEDPRVSQGNAL